MHVTSATQATEIVVTGAEGKVLLVFVCIDFESEIKYQPEC